MFFVKLLLIDFLPLTVYAVLLLNPDVLTQAYRLRLNFEPMVLLRCLPPLNPGLFLLLSQLVSFTWSGESCILVYSKEESFSCLKNTVSLLKISGLPIIFLFSSFLLSDIFTLYCTFLLLPVFPVVGLN
jgi:hypothetical protein